ncbi:MAG: diguanylate cyclase [Gammaproteobacteria bacterium]|nr:diguanylate cyclase [Gammaproteobacteria bacterium]
MTQDNANLQALDQWRQKYYSALEKLEQKEQQWDEMEKTLRRCISRLALAADGVHPEIDVQLESLRKAIRDGVGAAALQERIEAISRALLDIDQEAVSRQSVAASGAETAIAADKGAGAGFFDRLFGKRSAQGVAETPAAGAEDSRSPIVWEAVIQLLEQLSLQPEMTEAVESLKAQLGKQIDLHALMPSLQSVAVLVSGTLEKIRNEKSDLETFLRLLTDRLQEMDQYIADSAATHLASRQSQHRLDVEVHAQMDGIETTMREIGDIDQLKQAIQQRLDGIREHVDSFLHEETDLQTQADHQIEALTARLHDMETEIAQLHQRIRTEQENALQDALTGIPNRLAYEKRAMEECARWKRYKAPLTMIVADIDHFKRINDRYGHQAGDKVIKVIAQLMQKQLRDVDFVARYGGEEFVMLLPETAMEGACKAAEKLCAAVRGCEFQHSGLRVPITVSLGLAEFSGNDTPSQVFERADAALYRSKMKGRDQWQTEE